MRGKEVDGFGLARGLGITPAYAGKSARVDERGQGRKDHPRICREKKCPKAWCIGQQGSPPRMRGKVSVKEVKNAIKRITPAYAGKRTIGPTGHCVQRDHPRICGEKAHERRHQAVNEGSPPHMRGKAARRASVLGAAQDHPRICGEKLSHQSHLRPMGGSPPHMRGKALDVSLLASAFGITPAYAGKRNLRRNTGKT